MKDQIKKYRKFEILELALQMVGVKKIDSRFADRSLLKYLLPLDSAYGFYHTNIFSWQDLRDGKEYVEKFNPDDSSDNDRQKAVNRINKRIRDYNEFVKKHEEELGFDRIEEQQYFRSSYHWKWGLNLHIAQPTIPQMDNYNRDMDKLLMQVDNELCYKRGFMLTIDEFVPRFNKMMYDFLCLLKPKDLELTVDHILKNPIIEYENWFMMNGEVIEDIPSLIQEVKGSERDTRPSLPFGKTEHPVSLSTDPNHELRNAHRLLKKQKETIKQLRSPAEQRVKELIGTGKLDELVDSTRFKSSGKINWRKLGKLLGCSDNTAKKIINEHAPSYLLKDDEVGYID